LAAASASYSASDMMTFRFAGRLAAVLFFLVAMFFVLSVVFVPGGYVADPTDT